MTFISSVSLLLGIGALLCGIGMLNRREKALGRSIVFLWTYVAWLVIGFVWSVSELIMESIESSGRASNFLAETERFGVASTISSLIVSIITCLACIWLARRLSRPLIKRDCIRSITIRNICSLTHRLWPGPAGRKQSERVRLVYAQKQPLRTRRARASIRRTASKLLQLQRPHVKKPYKDCL